MVFDRNYAIIYARDDTVSRYQQCIWDTLQARRASWHISIAAFVSYPRVCTDVLCYVGMKGQGWDYQQKKMCLTFAGPGVRSFRWKQGFFFHSG